MTPTNRFQTDPTFPFPALRKCTLCVVHTPIKGAADKISLLLIKQINGNCEEKTQKYIFEFRKFCRLVDNLAVVN